MSAPIFIPTIVVIAGHSVEHSGIALTRRFDVGHWVPLHTKAIFQVKWEGEPNHEIPLYVGIHGLFRFE